jgi:prolyl-tRNA synthetase
VWPLEIAPFQAAVVVLDEADEPRVRPAADALVAQLEKAGLDVLEDDRDGKPGVKFKDIDLIGVPLRFVVSRKMVEQGSIEFKRRGAGAAEVWPLAEVASRLSAAVPNA